MQLTSDEFNKLLIEKKACEPAIKWCRGKGFTEAWTTCECGNWMLWLLRTMADMPGWPSLRTVVGLTGRIAGTVQYIYNEKYPEDSRVKNCIQATQDYEQGLIDEMQLRKFAYAADVATYAARAADAADDVAAYAAAADAYAAYAAYAADVATYAARAADDAARAAAFAAYADDVDAKLKEYAEMIRKEIKF